jgi:hypothetical protein
MYVEGHPWASTENIGDYYFDYLGPDPTTAGPTFRISCADGTVARAEAVFAQFGPSSVEITEDCIRVNMDSDGATVNATGGRINTEAM